MKCSSPGQHSAPPKKLSLPPKLFLVGINKYMFKLAGTNKKYRLNSISNIYMDVIALLAEL